MNYTQNQVYDNDKVDPIANANPNTLALFQVGHTALLERLSSAVLPILERKQSTSSIVSNPSTRFL
jgi:hypothetical protein